MRTLTSKSEFITAKVATGSSLLVLFNEHEAFGLAIEIQPSSNLSGLSQFISSQIQKLKMKDLTIKIVGPDRLNNSVRTALEKAGATVEKSVSKDSAFTALFYPKQGRLRIEKADTSPAQRLAPANSGSETQSINQSATQKQVRVLVVDDSSTIQKLLKTILESDPACTVVGQVTLPSQAEEAIKKFKPDVITMDVHMPEMNGVELLKILHPKYGIPTVMITSVSREEGDIVMDALSSGAVDYIQKPSFSEIDRVAPLIVEKVKMAALAKTKRSSSSAPKRKLSAGVMDQRKFIAIGSSTGGTEALREIFERLPAEIPPIVVVQHIPAVFSEALARRLNELCPFEVKEARDGDDLIAGRVLIAPGGKQMKVVRSNNGGFRVRVFDGEPVNRHKPSVDVLFDSVAAEIGNKAVGVILTGMGADGARGLVKMRERGSHTIAQDEASCVVFGMPREAIKMGGAEEVASLESISERLVDVLSTQKKSA